MEQASAPPTDADGERSSGSAPAPLLAPSAPAIPEDDLHEAHATSTDERRDSILPQYQR